MDIKIRLKNALNEFKKFQQNTFQNVNIKGLLTELEFLQNNIDKLELDERLTMYTNDLINKMIQALSKYEKTNNSFDENSVINYKNRIERALNKYEDLFNYNNFTEDMLVSILKEFEALRKELDSPEMSSAFSIDTNVRDNLAANLENKIDDLKEIYKTYYGDDYKPRNI